MFNYENKSTPSITEEFRQKYIISIKGKEAVKVEGLVVLAHEKGIWKLNTEIVQYPNQDNMWTAICKCTVGGYDYDPITNTVREVEYSDIADANPDNCTAMVQKSYIRMASTRAIGRALRKYTNFDMVCSSEIGEVLEESEPKITTQMLTNIKQAIRTKHIDANTYNRMLASFNKSDATLLTEKEGSRLLELVQEYIPTQQS